MRAVGLPVLQSLARAITRYAPAAKWGEISARKSVARVWAESWRHSASISTSAPISRHQRQQSGQPGDRRARPSGRTPEEVISAALPFIKGMEDSRRDGMRKAFSRTRGYKGGLAFRTARLGSVARRARGPRVEGPFVAAIRAGIEMIMTSHIIFHNDRQGEPRHSLAEAYARPAAFEMRVQRRHRIRRCPGMHAMDGLLAAPDSALAFLAAGNDS